ncbi:hypothetical protein H0H93_004002 [Arthromyces matolae]|nr:hypothetical protein H0H93_004002 [Arthromyces matolae]
MIKNNRPSHSSSFTLARLPANTLPSPSPGNSPSLGSPTPTETSRLAALVNPLPLVLVFHDQTPILTVGTFTGLIELDLNEERDMGVDTSFWIAIALTYLEFLEERESYLAALSD